MKIYVKVILTALLLSVATAIPAEVISIDPARWEGIINKVFSIAIYVIIIGFLIGILSLRKIKRNYGGRPPARKSWSGFSGSSGGVPYGDGFKALHSNDDDKE
ncbi:MAG: hypothetical protein JXB48_01680 [Candidatus Latescibacteria bacterium]|nr:hypothetical protein [Candidatus Latescibacterota bacterium]